MYTYQSSNNQHASGSGSSRAPSNGNFEQERGYPPQRPTAIDMARLPQDGTQIGAPLAFLSGQFAGQRVRAELLEIQSASVGRKYARVDRRPLDPPPVVLLKLFQVFNYGTSQESEREFDYDEVQNIGLIAHVDLFPCAPDNAATTSAPLYSTAPGQPLPTYPLTQTYQPASPYTFVPPSSQQHSYSSGSTFRSPQGQRHYPTEDVIHRVGSYSVTEGSKLTPELVGATFVQPANVEYNGKPALMFVFADIAVKLEGSFLLRYRFMDIFSQTAPDTIVVQAETYGGTFRVYSTKEFPGLAASSPLTKTLNMFGVRVNIRENERKRRRKADSENEDQQKRRRGRATNEDD